MFSVFYKTDCFGKVLKLQTLQIALWGEYVHGSTQSLVLSGFVFCYYYRGLKSPNSGNCKDREGEKREGKCPQLQSCVQV